MVSNFSTISLFFSIILSSLIVLLAIDPRYKESFSKVDLNLRKKYYPFLLDGEGEVKIKRLSLFYWVLLIAVFFISIGVFYKNEDIALLVITILICRKAIQKVKGKSNDNL